MRIAFSVETKDRQLCLKGPGSRGEFSKHRQWNLWLDEFINSGGGSLPATIG